MCVAVAGGLKKNERDYRNLSKKYGIKCKVFNEKVPDLKKRIQHVDAVVIFTGVVGHKMVEVCNTVCRKQNIALKRIHSNSLQVFEETLKKIQEEK